MSTFFYQFLKHPFQVSTPFKIGPSLADKMARNVEGKVVAEFGSGTGAVTEYILRYLPENGRLYCLEINPAFCDELRKIQDPRVRVINAPAQNIYSHINEKVDCVVCSVPLTVMRKKTRGDILEAAVKSNLFIPMQCWLPTMTDLLKNYFEDISHRFVLNNLPPSWYYVCRKRAD